MSDVLDEARKRYMGGDFSGAEALFEQARSEPTSRAGAAYGLGLIAFARKQYPSAEDHFTECHQLAPEHADAMFYLGEIARLRGARTSAKNWYQQVLQVNPAHAGALKKTDSPPTASQQFSAPSRTSEPGPRTFDQPTQPLPPVGVNTGPAAAPLYPQERRHRTLAQEADDRADSSTFVGGTYLDMHRVRRSFLDPLPRLVPVLILGVLAWVLTHAATGLARGVSVTSPAASWSFTGTTRFVEFLAATIVVGSLVSTWPGRILGKAFRWVLLLVIVLGGLYVTTGTNLFPSGNLPTDTTVNSGTVEQVFFGFVAELARVAIASTIGGLLFVLLMASLRSQFTRYIIYDRRVDIFTGIFNHDQRSMWLYDVETNVEVTQSVLGTILGYATVITPLPLQGVPVKLAQPLAEHLRRRIIEERREMKKSWI